MIRQVTFGFLISMMSSCILRHQFRYNERMFVAGSVIYVIDVIYFFLFSLFSLLFHRATYFSLRVLKWLATKPRMIVKRHAYVAVQFMMSIRHSSSSSRKMQGRSITWPHCMSSYGPIMSTSLIDAELSNCSVVFNDWNALQLHLRRVLQPLTLQCYRLCPAFIRFRSRLLSCTLYYWLSGCYVPSSVSFRLTSLIP